MNVFAQRRQLPSPSASNSSSPKESPRSNRNNNSQIPVKINSTSNPAPLLRSRSRDFIDAVKAFEGGKLPDKLLKTISEDRSATYHRLASCENDLKEIRDFIVRTQEDFKSIRGQTKALRNGIDDLHNLSRWLSTSQE